MRLEPAPWSAISTAAAMLEQAQGLTTVALAAIDSLERRVVANDGGRLKLEWGALRSRPAEKVRDLLWWEGARLVGFLGIYTHGWPTVELTGMVDPEARRRGIGQALYDAAMSICHTDESERMLLVVPRTSLAGRGFATRQGLAYHHSEHALRLSERPADGPTDPTLGVREATDDDVPELKRLLIDGFGELHMDRSRPLVDDYRRTLMIEREGEAVGTLSVAFEGDGAAIYGFVVASDWRGRGVGRATLTHVTRDLFDAGAERVELEVEVTNDRALSLYTSIGFSQVVTEDYYEADLT
jgi:ribosomal protein S18 acetylase RimI-like enzyme